MLYIILGKSGSGKDTVVNAVLERMPELCKYIQWTSRPARPGEVHGKDYYFSTNYRMPNNIIAFESYAVHDAVWNYGFADQDLSDGDYICIASPRLAKQLIYHYGQNHCTGIYIGCSDAVRIHRVLEREEHKDNPDYVEMCRRFESDDHVYSPYRLSGLCSTSVVNDGDLEHSITQLVKLLTL